MRGRKPKPTTQRRLEGNPGKRRLNTREPEPPLLTEATFSGTPLELVGNPLAVAEWHRLAPMLQQAKQISAADRAALIALCLEWARYLDAVALVAKKGMIVRSPSGYPMTNPLLSIASRALAACNKLWPELGLTPSSRSRVTTTPEARADDPFIEFDTPPPLH